MNYYELNTDNHSQYSAPVAILLCKRLKEMNTFVYHNLTKDLTKFQFQINSVLLNFLFIKESWKM